MNEFPLSFFNPTQDWSLILPYFFMFLILIGALFLIWWFFEYLRRKKAKKREQEEFLSIANARNLERRQIRVLEILAKKYRIHPKSRLLTEQDRFERAIFTSGKDDQRMMIQDMREKLFGKSFKPSDPMNNTRQLVPGSRLFLKYDGLKDTAIWGHLVDVDDVGLVTVIPSYREVKIPLRPQTNLTVWAYRQGAPPIKFKTRVNTVIPGPRKMVVLEHNSFVRQENTDKVSYSYPLPQNHKKQALSDLTKKDSSLTSIFL